MKRSSLLLDHRWSVVAILTLLAGAALGLILSDQANAARVVRATLPIARSTPAPKVQGTPIADQSAVVTAPSTFQNPGASFVVRPLTPLDCSDPYEPDNTPATARSLPLDRSSQNHTFHVTGDEDWFRFQASAGTIYTVTTSNLLSAVDPLGGIAHTDTIMFLYDSNSTSELARNDDYLPNNLASRIVWSAPHSGWFYIRVMDFYGRGLCLGYTITGSHGPTRVMLPMLLYQPSATPTPSPTPSPTPFPTPAVTDVPVPGLLHPNSLAVNSSTQRVYVTSRDNNKVFMLDGRTFAVLKEATVCASPWGIAVNPETGKLYVSCFESGDIFVMDAATLDLQTDIALSSGPDWELAMMAIDPSQQSIFVASHARNAVVVVSDSSSYRLAAANGVGTWGVAADPNLKRVYVTNRDTANLSTLDAASGYKYLAEYTIAPCRDKRAIPYGLGFNPANSKLYVSCNVNGSVDRLAVYTAGATGLQYVTTVPTGKGGNDGGGGIAVNPLTGHVFVTNSAANTVSIINGNTDSPLVEVPVGSDPFGIAVDTSTGLVFVADRGGSDIHVFADPSTP
jgi:YVTN family beta-propeller protein